MTLQAQVVLAALKSLGDEKHTDKKNLQKMKEHMSESRLTTNSFY